MPSDEQWIITAAVIGGGILILVLIVLLIRRCYLRGKQKRLETHPTSEQSVERLIPPIFYTDGLKDPLYQADLVDPAKFAQHD